MDRSQKLINLFISETTESACIRICICITVVIDIIMAIQHIDVIRILSSKDYHGSHLNHSTNSVLKTRNHLHKK